MKFWITSILSLFFYASQAQEVYFPSDTLWEERLPETFELNLDAAIDFAKNNEYSGSRDLEQAILKGFEREPFHKIMGPVKHRGGPAGLILKNGYKIAEWGDVKRVDMTFSVTKSFLSTTALIALQENAIQNVNHSVSSYIWDDTFRGPHNSQITWKQLLQQNSDWSGELWDSYDWADRPANDGNLDTWRNRKLNKPGTFFKYNDVRVNVLAYSLLQVLRKPLPSVLKEKIMDPINASNSWRWFGYDNSWTNIDGYKMQSVSGGGHSGGGMFINTEDMARFGLLFMNNGVWNDQRLIEQDLISEAVLPSLTNPNYGYMWWLNAKGDRHMENIDKDLFYAAGFGGNFIIIDQKQKLMIVTRWLEPSKLEEFLNLIYKK
ncbi:serine hydrolase domain-containing protein [Christiangramia portivictoriae]|uniref:serine hydrolase domain-containing protein n=1 Tax=Christiangramia portivictoriae TaxID=326069 RepID=UPI0004172652|nr:serine hydrolase [Christiangramia portivictoriae]